ncbi:DUF4291 domain-containing protein [Aeoliella sp. ICT_H6.2]|uniref:DUF4291 domain-containing protein n=1 Tax=Aeoliella straminimaris TaxID=2954799 RepID=A0A9X2FFM5_9BACT|nr:DUF4291 domain-containing protein [Aeoliella straminimaris]MCO6043231.1 DUF4291 domain-containing protein [Aeoliella straminimaris]
MPAYHEIRADYDRDTIVIYQAYRAEIADAAIAAGRFVAPFSFGRMTWIKPSFLWLMERSNWGRKSGQERTLAVRITREGWNSALSQGVLTSFHPQVHGTPNAWRTTFEGAKVHVQWDPERSLNGKKLEHRSIQVGLSRHVIAEFANEWTVELRDLTQMVGKIRRLRDEGHRDRAKQLLPPERVYNVDPLTASQLAMP